jgi:hypothetical protein
MAYTTNQLISNSYYTAGIVAREFEGVSGSQVSDGLTYLNEILGEKTVDDGMIPYESTTTVTGVIGQEAYTIANCISIDTLTFTKNNVRYSMSYDKRNAYFGSDRVNNINSLPQVWYFERGFGGGTLYIYFTPDFAYPLEIHGVFRLSEVALGQDLSLTLDSFYTTYLKYALADRLCAEFNYATPENVLRQLAKYEGWINKKSKLIDLRVQKQSTLQTTRGGGWAQVNLGRGWIPPY